MKQQIQILLYGFLFASQVHGMEISKELIEDDSSRNPAKNSDGICHLARLPKDVLNLIAEYLLFPGEESDYDFMERLKKLAAGLAIKKDDEEDEYFVSPYGTVFINDKGSLLCKNKEQTKYLIPVDSEKKILGRSLARVKDIFTDTFDRKKITHVVQSYNKLYVAALKKFRDRDSITQLVGLYVCNLKTNKVEKIGVDAIPREILVKKNSDVAQARKMGYTMIGSSLIEDEVYLVNPIGVLAVSFDGNIIACANQTHVYVSCREKNNKWSPHKCCRNYVDKISGRTWTFPKMIGHLEFNKQGTKLGIINKVVKSKILGFEIENLAPEKIKTLKDYLHHRLVCKDIESQKK